MYQSEVIGKFFKNIEESEETKKRQKEKDIARVLQHLKPWKMNLKSIVIFNVVLLLFCSFMDVFNNNPNIHYMKFVINLLSFFNVVMGLVLIFIYYDNRRFYLSNLKELFLNLSDKPYEIRLSYEKDKKIKIVIEENLYCEHSHVIKEKSKHLTAYLDYTQSQESIVKFIIELVKKSELLFK